ncbi:MAG: CPBP family intramembrane metalloprotease [Chlorobiaceae bacterium]|nr:CPBP family intramembrane metalloprotease [Chlorobiaceae bacterium]NTV60884.1 CPBP family intramembrane metalloprotease [Chlorobiaceae bacterium]
MESARYPYDEFVLKARKQLAVSLSVLFFVPSMIFSGFIPFVWRFFALLSIAVLFAYQAYRHGFTPEELGVKSGNILRALRIQIPLVLVFLLLLSIAPELGFVSRSVMPPPLFFLFYVLVSAPCQEFIYRGYIYALLKRSGVRDSRAAALFLIIPFAFAHIIFHDFMVFLFALIAGIFLAAAYIREMNLYVVSLSHGILGCFALISGVI